VRSAAPGRPQIGDSTRPAGVPLVEAAGAKRACNGRSLRHLKQTSGRCSKTCWSPQQGAGRMWETGHCLCRVGPASAREARRWQVVRPFVRFCSLQRAAARSRVPQRRPSRSTCCAWPSWSGAAAGPRPKGYSPTDHGGTRSDRSRPLSKMVVMAFFLRVMRLRRLGQDRGKFPRLPGCHSSTRPRRTPAPPPTRSTRPERVERQGARSARDARAKRHTS